MVKDKAKEYQVTAKIEIFVSIPVQANTLQEAVDKSKDLKKTLFYTPHGELIDETFEITGVYC